MRTQFRDSENTSAQETDKHENLQKSTLLEADEAKTETEKKEVSETSELPDNKADTTDFDESILDDNGDEVNEGEFLPPNKTFRLNGIEYTTDDNGKIYCIDGEKIPNTNYILNEVTYKTDDNGNIYSIDRKLQPNITYELNGNTYTTDEKGRIIGCVAKPVRSPENPRDNEAQRQAGGEDRRLSDQGGHIVGRDMNGDGGIGNLIAMDSRINQSDYKCMENNIKASLDEGKDVTTKTEMTYSDDSERPDIITVTVTVDGKDTVYIFDNNLDGVLDAEVIEKSPVAKQIIKDYPEAHVSSIRKEYDEDGKLVRTTVRITYTDENGNIRRNQIYINSRR
jgi:hypothetical protein